jgi:ATP-binding cassette subfamily F protein uup
LQFKGTVLLVSHDREFMDNVVTSILVLEGDGRISEHVGGYSNWTEHGGKLVGLDEKQKSPAPTPDRADPAKPGLASPTAKKLSYKDQRELEALPARIEELENRQTELETLVSATDFYQQEYALTEATLKELADLQAELEIAYQRWEQLEG